MVLLLSLVAGCGHAEPPPPPPTSQAAPSESEEPSPDEDSDLPDKTAADGRGVIRPLAAPTGCTTTAQDADAAKQALAAAKPGATICVLGDLDTRLTITTSGTAQAPIHVVGDGKTIVKGIDVTASFVQISGVNALEPHAPGISLHGNDLTLENSTSISPHGDDGDGIRFWGSNIVIRHNTIKHTSNKHKAHADCMQTFATDSDSPASQHILIDSNRCEDISNTCLIMEGPNSLAGDGSGVGATNDVTWTNNYCQNHADEALQIDDVQGLKVHDNDIAGKINHAFALQNKTTGAQIGNNKLNSEISYEVGIDDTSKPGYQGPPPGGKP
ncbi:right-handed parallel beta-helix repeat-containing protein [Pseudonocardia spinosispora]|uniref:right-handed parallel beta-helix repeat-containing protein n=1 Tax=Pseudonocardia spinosispora TaxID=103441 RepID=UPI00146FB765|nr:right-handed parallel beta-helix repeat-containing protein [Pseudonocardia spinosispora]